MMYGILLGGTVVKISSDGDESISVGKSLGRGVADRA